MPVHDLPADEGDDAPRESYNFAPGYRGVVYRADVPDHGCGPAPDRQTRGGQAAAAHGDEDSDVSAKTVEKQVEGTEVMEAEETDGVHYKLQTMKWGLIPFWTKRNPDYGSMMKTINCRGDSLAKDGGMWNNMKRRKRCIIITQGFYEWLKKGKEKVPHYTKRKDEQLMLMAGLWDCVQYEDSGEKLYTYTIITTESNNQLSFLHDRMPVILDNGSEEMWRWLDPKRSTWSKELQQCLRPYEGELECYPVSRDVGKVGNNNPTFIVPVASKDNKNNIANFFTGGGNKPKFELKEVVKDEENVRKEDEVTQDETELKQEVTRNPADKAQEVKSEVSMKDEVEKESVKTEDIARSEENAPMPVDEAGEKTGYKGVKREHEEEDEVDEPPAKTAKTGRRQRSATINDRGVFIPKKRGKVAEEGSQKITGFFKKS